MENITIITVIAVIVPPFTDPGAERFLLVVDIAQGAESTAAVSIPFRSLSKLYMDCLDNHINHILSDPFYNFFVE